MKTSLFLAMCLALPVVAQETAPQQATTLPAPEARQGAPEGRPGRPELTEEQKAERKAKMLEKFDADKDGQLSEEEKQAMHAEMKKNRPQHGQGPKGEGRGEGKGQGHGPKGEGRPQRPQMTEEQKAKMLEKFDTDKDGQISEEEKKAMHAEFQKHRQSKQGQGRPEAKGPRGPKGDGKGPHGKGQGPKGEGNPQGNCGECSTKA